MTDNQTTKEKIKGWAPTTIAAVALAGLLVGPTVWLHNVTQDDTTALEDRMDTRFDVIQDDLTALESRMDSRFDRLETQIDRLLEIHLTNRVAER